MHVQCMSMLVVLCIYLPLLAEEALPHSNSAIGLEFSDLDLTRENDRKLFAFCQAALLRERGLARYPGTTDKWIVESLLSNKEFQKVFDSLPELQVFKGDSKESPRKDGHDAVDLYQHSGRYRVDLRSKLTDKQVANLPVVYLHTDGLMALCRPEFSKMFDDIRSQERIKRVVQDIWEKRAAKLHRALFTLSNLDESPIVEVQLRMAAMEVDLKVVKELAVNEREKLVELISASSNLGRVIRSSASY